MRPVRASAIVLALAGAACANSDLTSEYGKPQGATGAGATAGSAAGGAGAGAATGGSSGAAAAGKAGSSAGTGGVGASSGGGGSAGAAGTSGAGGGAGSAGASGKGGVAGKGGSGATGGTQGGSGGTAGKGGVSGMAGSTAGTGGGKSGMGGTATSGGGGSGAGGNTSGKGGNPATGGGGAGGSGGVGGNAGAGGVVTPVCGNGIAEPGEECDVGSGVYMNGCFPTCTTSVAFHTGSYAEASGDVLSPERGYRGDVDLTSSGDYFYVRQQGNSVADAFVLLTPFIGGPIDAGFLTKLQSGLDRVRAAGIKVILRFAYEQTGGTDAPKAIILQHIQQLAPLLASNVDVIALMQAGFIGEYGAWYSSTNNLTNATDEGDILSALLAALPAGRSVLVRTPTQKNALYPGGPLVAANAHDGSDKSRVGHSDDCFLSSDDDFGTYAAPTAMWEDYVAKDSVYVPVAGASCGVSPPRSDCPFALSELAAHHFSHLSGYYDAAAIAAWKSQGCYDTIGAALGYRLFVATGAYLDKVRPGGALGLQLHLKNGGYAAPYNARPFQVVLTNGATRLVADVPGIDVRTWLSGQDIQLDLWFRLPTWLGKGAYDVALLLPDAESSIAAVPEYAVHLANASGFNVFTGDNVIGSLLVDPAAPGAIDPGASSFAYLPP